MWRPELQDPTVSNLFPVVLVSIPVPHFHRPVERRKSADNGEEYHLVSP
jgi:hypothetical protein